MLCPLVFGSPQLLSVFPLRGKKERMHACMHGIISSDRGIPRNSISYERKKKIKEKNDRIKKEFRSVPTSPSTATALPAMYSEFASVQAHEDAAWSVAWGKGASQHLLITVRAMDPSSPLSSPLSHTLSHTHSR